MNNNTLTAQQVFDQVTAHLRKQGRRATNGGRCYYRYTNQGETLSCAAGCLIREDEYASWMDGNNYDTSFNAMMRREDIPVSMKERLGPHVKLIRDLQVLHDNGNVTRWESRLAEVASEHGLIYTAPAT